METFKRVVSLLLCFVMLVGVVPFGAMATETTEPETAETLPVVEETEEVTGLVGSTEATEEATEEETSEPTEGEETESTEVETLPIITDEGGAIDLQAVTEAANNYPEYPDEGAVRVNKTGTGIDFQSTGIAQVEISATGVPMKKGADLIIMLDTSSSMTKNEVTGSNGKKRNEVLEEALAQLLAQLKKPGADGEFMDIRVAIADFNGYYGYGSDGAAMNDMNNKGKLETNTRYDAEDKTDAVKGGNPSGGYKQKSEARVYTGTGTLTAGAFINAADLEASYTLNYTSGTNYDYAFDAIAQMATSIQDANEKAGDERDLFVIFMSDGASLQWNYFRAQNTYDKWNNWLAGTWTADDLTTSNLSSETHSYYYDLNDYDKDGHINEHRMASAIKGSPNDTFEVIRKNQNLAANQDSLYKRLTAVTGKDNLYTMKGLGATVFTINFDSKKDGSITQASIEKALASTASDQTGSTQYYYKVTTADQLKNAFTAIGDEVTYAAYNARFVDKMGPEYDLKLSTYTYTMDGANKTIAPVIEVLNYELYTEGENLGARTGEYTVLETVTFSADGTKAYSSLIDNGTTNILVNGIIRAKSFYYNTTSAAVAVDGVDIPTAVNETTGLTSGSTNMLPAETFYWMMGTVKSSEMALRYYVYLENSMNPGHTAGSFPTNEYADLYYDNYLGNSCVKETVSPILPWLDANVTYVFYLVDENGDIIVNQATGTTGSFLYRIAVTTPVTISDLKLNGEANTCKASDVKDVLPNGYELYDEAATYTVKINSDGTGEWWIVRGTDKAATTYVTQYNGDAYTNVEHSTNSGDYTHTMVWFAVKWTGELTPDTVVVDFGLPVDIDVSTNDEVSGVDGKLYGISLDKQPVDTNNNNAAMNTGVYRTPVMGNGTVDHNSITAAKNGDLVRVQIKDTQFHEPVTFRYEVSVNTGNSNIGYMYSTVTVIPATTIYYEDSFVTFTDSKNAYQLEDKTWIGQWSVEGTEQNATQAQDRPGESQISATLDRDNNYGYDQAYLNMAKYSMGSTHKVNVASGVSGMASFDFYGTGFDVISLTDSTTGVIIVQVTKEVKDEQGQTVMGEDGKPKMEVVCSYTVDTYYGYTYNNGAWEVVEPSNANALYQVPVMKVAGLEYGKYTVKIVANYNEAFDHTDANDYYSFYMDAVRIYDPAGNQNATANNAYKQDGEAYPTYTELRNLIIKAADFNALVGEDVASGVVFIDGKSNDVSIADYTSYGPNNELYLATNQAIAFNLAAPVNMAKIQLALKTVGGTSHIQVYSADNVDEKILNLDVNSATDLYYDITALAGKTVVIKNTGNGILSLTNIKTTYTEAQTQTQTTALLTITRSSASAALLSLRAPVVEEEPSVPETEPVFAPEKFQVKVSKKSVEAGKQVDVVVTTSADVDAVSIDGQMVTGKYDKKKNVYTWTARIQTDAGDVGTMTIEVVAYDEDGVASEAESVDVTVTAKKGKEVKKK